MNREDSHPIPSWFFALVGVSCLVTSVAVFYRLVLHTDHDYVVVDQQGTGTWSENKLVVPRLFNRKTGEFSEYRGADAKPDYTSQTLRGPWLSYPGPHTK